MPQDCCCWCFSLKTGSILIGLLSTLSFVGTMISGLSLYEEMWQWFLPSMILQGATVLAFFRMLKSLDTEHDEAARHRFALTYVYAYFYLDLIFTLIRSFQKDFVENFCEINVQAGIYDTESRCNDTQGMAYFY